MHLELDKPLLLPEELREELRRVHGELVGEDELEKKISGRFVISVGDVVTHTLLEHGILPDVAIVDYRTKRGRVIFDDISSFGEVVLKVSNPPGSIHRSFGRR